MHNFKITLPFVIPAPTYNATIIFLNTIVLPSTIDFLCTQTKHTGTNWHFKLVKCVIANAFDDSHHCNHTQMRIPVIDV